MKDFNSVGEQPAEGVERTSWDDLGDVKFAGDKVENDADAPSEAFTVDEIMEEFSGGVGASSEQITPDGVREGVAIIKGAMTSEQGGPAMGRHEAPAGVPEVSTQEMERRKKADIAALGSRMDHYEKAFRERGVPENLLHEAGLALDLLDDLSVQMEDDEDSSKSAYERMQDMAEKYDKLYKRTRIPGRKKEYFDKAQVARSESRQFKDWAGADKKNSRSAQTMQKLMNLIS